MRAQFITLDYTEEALPVPLLRETGSRRRAIPRPRGTFGVFALSAFVVIGISAGAAAVTATWIAPAIAQVVHVP